MKLQRRYTMPPMLTQSQTTVKLPTDIEMFQWFKSDLYKIRKTKAETVKSQQKRERKSRSELLARINEILGDAIDIPLDKSITGFLPNTQWV